VDAKLALAFSAGMVATVNPCGFALLPAYLSYFLGLDGDATAGAGGTAATARPNPVLRALAVSAAVTAGFLVVFGVMGLAWSSVSGVIGRRLPYVTVVIGVALVALGVAMLRGFEPTVRLPKLELTRNGRELSSMFLYGISYAVASLSCTIGVFISIVSTTLERSNFASSFATFLAYGLGMGMTLAILTIGVALARSGILRTFRRVLPYVNRISAVLLVFAGTFVAYYAWVEIQELNGGSTSAVVRWTRDLQSSLQNWVERTGATRLALGALIVIAAAVAVTVVARRPGPEDPGPSESAPAPVGDHRADQPLRG
jgi:cytochrome c-type biogenesis protein